MPLLLLLEPAAAIPLLINCCELWLLWLSISLPNITVCIPIQHIEGAVAVHVRSVEAFRMKKAFAKEHSQDVQMYVKSQVEE